MCSSFYCDCVLVFVFVIIVYICLRMSYVNVFVEMPLYVKQFELSMQTR